MQAGLCPHGANMYITFTWMVLKHFHCLDWFVAQVQTFQNGIAGQISHPSNISEQCTKKRIPHCTTQGCTTKLKLVNIFMLHKFTDINSYECRNIRKHVMCVLDLRQGGCKRQQQDGEDNVVDVCEQQASMLSTRSPTLLVRLSLERRQLV